MFEFSTAFTLKGRWWLPGDTKSAETAIQGELSYTPTGGLSLLAEGSFHQITNLHETKQNFLLHCVLGITKEGNYITLFNCFGIEVGRTGWISTELSIEYAFCSKKGYWAPADVSLTGVNFSSNCFTAFFRGVLKKLQLDPRDNGMRFNYDEVAPIYLTNAGASSAYFFVSHSFSGLGMMADKFNFQATVYLNVPFDKELLPADIIRKVNFHKDLFSLFSYRRVSFEAINVFAKNKEGDTVEFSLLYKDPGYTVETNFSGFDMLLFYKELESSLPAIFQHWVDNEAALQSGLLLYMQTKNLRFPSSIQSFLNMVFALETLHNTYFNTNNRKIIFRDCLLELINQQQALLADYIYDADDFSKRVKQQRNFLAHNHSEMAKAGLEEKYYRYFIAMLQLIFESCFLPRLGISQPLIELFVKRNFTYQQQKEKLATLKKELL